MELEKKTIKNNYDADDVGIEIVALALSCYICFFINQQKYLPCLPLFLFSAGLRNLPSM